MATHDRLAASNRGGATRLSASIVIPTRDKVAYLDLSLASYVRQQDAPFEIVVVNDGGSQDVEPTIQRYRGRLALKYLNRPHAGRAAARNAGVAVAEGDVVIFADDDRIAGPRFVAEHLSHHASASDDKHVLGWQRGILTWWDARLAGEPHVQAALGRWPEALERASLAGSVALATSADVEEALSALCERGSFDEPWWERRCSTVITRSANKLSRYRLRWFLGNTGNLSLTRRSFTDVGGFDENFRRWGLEDSELCYRLVQRGSPLVVASAAVNYHQAHVRTPTRFDDWESNLDYFITKHGGIEGYLYRLWAKGRALEELERVAREFMRPMRRRPYLAAELARLYCESRAHERSGIVTDVDPPKVPLACQAGTPQALIA